MNNKVFTIVLNWNNINDTSETLDCLLNQVYDNHKIILVDNNSKSDVKLFFHKKYDNILFIENKSNLGYTGGNNVGIKYALKMKADIIIISNNDIFIEDNCLISKIVETFNEYGNKISILGPQLKYYSAREEIQEAGSTFFYTNGDKYLFNDFIINDKYLSSNVQYYDGVPGAFMALRSEVFTKIGYFDENIFMYGDETDLCYRAWINNERAAVNHNLIVYHKASSNKSTMNPLTIYYKTRNSLYLLKKHKTTIRHYKYFLKKYYRNIFGVMISLLLKKEKVLLKSYSQGLWDGFWNRYGKRG